MDTQPHARPQHRNLLHQARQSPRHHCHFSRTFQRVLEEAGAVFDSRPDAISAQITSDGYLTLALSPSGDQWAKMRRVMRSGVLSNAVFNGYMIRDARKPITSSDMCFGLDGHKKKITNAIKNVRRYQDPEIKKRIEMWEKGLKSEDDDILDLLINLKKSGNEPILSI
ncbi:hypothetical protein SASPL_141528 [Salvia splendens]|uniref:Uncharacterized protein n=1 Tax=Salvia splendens TaxID=180675 RepID=A0A8X8WT90_SALSN|nr:hypothetical protein SASPL_141528 [Salvia splendens]